MRGIGKNKTNWALTALLVIAFQYIAFMYVIPMTVGLDVLTVEYLQENSWIIGVTAVTTIILAWISAWFIKRNFFNAGKAAGGAY